MFRDIWVVAALSGEIVLVKTTQDEMQSAISTMGMLVLQSHISLFPLASNLNLS